MKLQIDRMKIDDVGGNPKKIASSVLQQIQELPLPIPIQDIAKALGIYEIREESIASFEGALIAPIEKNEGAILVNAKQTRKRKRYTIAHELGHYLNPWHESLPHKKVHCDSKDMTIEGHKTNNREIKMEIEANEFAAEILMPSHLFQKRIQDNRELGLECIISLADIFEVSREATARRYVNYVDEPMAVIFSQQGKIRYIKKHSDFPRLSVWNKDPLPNGSLSKNNKLEIGKVSEWEKIDGTIWLDKPAGINVCEQTLSQRNGFRTTLLALENPLDIEVEPDEDVWEEPIIR